MSLEHCGLICSNEGSHIDVEPILIPVVDFQLQQRSLPRPLRNYLL